MEKFSEACVIASTHTILLVQNAFDAGYLSRRNPAVIYFLFAATLVILANEFAGLYRVDASDTCILNAVNIMNYCAESDQQASRLVYILSTFRDVVAQQRMRRKQNQSDNTNLPSISSQLYGVAAPTQQHAQPPNRGLTTSTDPMTATTRLHQVPIHIYPGMQTAPLDTTPPGFQPPHVPHATSLPPHQTLSQLSPPTTDFSVHLSPINDASASGPGSDAYVLGAAAAHPPSKSPSLSTLLDLSALDSTRVPSLHSEESGLDEHIDFDALWAWPSNTPAMGSPRPGADGSAALAGSAAGEGAPVPLFGISHEGRERAE